MASPVFFSDFRVHSGKTILNRVDLLLDRVNLKKKVREKDLVALKLHFGEKGNTSYIPPIFLRRIVNYIKRSKGKPFLTDTNTLYVGTRGEAISHMTTAYENGFVFSVVDAPIVIADGLRGNNGVKVRIDKPIFETVSVAHAITMADVLISIAHFTGHELCGFGCALKNLGMGCASREGKLSQHSNISPRVKTKTCTGCESCLAWCSVGAISMTSPGAEATQKRGVAVIDSGKCIGCGECIQVCPPGAIHIQWNETIPHFQKKMVEYAYGAIQRKKGKTVCLNFLTQMTPGCDCHEYSDTPIVNDIGILASEDPVAIDQASADLVNQALGNRSSKLTKNWEPGEDKFKALFPEVDWTIQLAYGEEIGLGTRQYELIKV